MKITKLFLTVYGEKKWLERMAKDGYALSKRRGISYIFEKTEKDTRYQYIFLKKGRASFVALDYKKKDSDAAAVYGNGYVALFKKTGENPQIISGEELKKNYLQYRQRRMTASLCILAAALCAAAVARIIAPLWLIAAFCLVPAIVYMADAKAAEKMIKEL